ncbi:MAG: DUF503 domain-containing protein [Candidatus Tectomicrobia bacterium]|uniref:DUF503 domain-containing protein n=1 Tax=Tectimicrobiota bacterium TaxID=2528274 RepID=A0A932LZZ1_UNCTE|nr:DUF503 domain-containing protein [Candidatus Tectomicrobia bacterium]
MVVGVCTVELLIPSMGSLKGKRQVVKSLISRLQNKFKVSVAEVDENDKWQKAIIGIAAVSNEANHATRVLQSVVNYIDRETASQLLDYSIEIL